MYSLWPGTVGHPAERRRPRQGKLVGDIVVSGYWGRLSSFSPRNREEIKGGSGGNQAWSFPATANGISSTLQPWELISRVSST